MYSRKINDLTGLLSKKQIPTIATVLLLVQPPLVLAENNTAESYWYLAGSLGTGTFRDVELVSGGSPHALNLDNDVTGGIALGYRFKPLSSTRYRTEIELWGFRPGIDQYNGTAISADSGSSVNITALMNNGFINFMDSSQLSPYIGAGIGIASVEIDAVTTNQRDDFVWSYQLLAGLDYKLETISNLNLSIGYRLFYMQDAKYYFGRLEDGEIHAAAVPLRYGF